MYCPQCFKAMKKASMTLPKGQENMYWDCESCGVRMKLWRLRG